MHNEINSKAKKCQWNSANCANNKKIKNLNDLNRCYVMKKLIKLNCLIIVASMHIADDRTARKRCAHTAMSLLHTNDNDNDNEHCLVSNLFSIDFFLFYIFLHENLIFLILKFMCMCKFLFGKNKIKYKKKGRREKCLT